MLNRNLFGTFFFILTLLLISGFDTQAQFPENMEITKISKIQKNREIQKFSVDSYKAHKDYASLEIISRNLSKGMEHGAVKELLGEPDYSPIAGQYYYSSDLRKTEIQGKKWIDVPFGLIVDYRDEQGRVTEKLQTFKLGRIGE
ncbi:MAG: hypothetical protein D3903_09815 [Candidatus Electrothrix sp. GM3_4]|nr:hypothetical protein [Candidatus Electrothrix sp. GM3_4]